MNWRLLFGLLLFGAATIGLWPTPVLWPLKVLVVFIHEIFHALAAIVTGGRVVEIDVQANESGHALTQGGFLPLIYSAGYLGSSLTGALMLRAAAYPRLAPFVLGGLGALIGVMTLLYVRLTNLTGFIFGLAVAALLIFLAVKRVKFLNLGVMGLAVMCCLYSVYDFADYLVGDASKTDAGFLAEYLHLPGLGVVIGVVWSLISLWLMWWGLKGSLRLPPEAAAAPRDGVSPDEVT